YWSNGAGGHEGEPLAHSVYFPGTIRNVGEAAYEGDFLAGHAKQPNGDGTETTVQDQDIRGLSLESGGIPTDTSATFADGFSIRSLDDLEYEIAIDGLSGITLAFAAG